MINTFIDKPGKKSYNEADRGDKRTLCVLLNAECKMQSAKLRKWTVDREGHRFAMHNA